MTSQTALPRRGHDELAVTGVEESTSLERERVVERLVETVRSEALRDRLPNSTYRLQFSADFTFDSAVQIAPYLRALGITHIYASPYMQANPASRHGYDIVDHNALSRELGGDAGFARFVEALRAQGLRHILDWVPNHMGVGTDRNAWWQDVLENGPSSPYAQFFDIDWAPLKSDLANKVLLPVLGDQFGKVLESGQLRLGFVDGAFGLNYFDRQFPLAPTSQTLILRHRSEELEAALGPESEPWAEYQSILTAISHLPPRDVRDPEKIAERRREKDVIKRRLAQLVEQAPHVQRFIEENVAAFNGTPGDPRSFDLLDALLQEQAYRLCYWRVAADEINYRRFFDVNDLAALCMEDPTVFDEAHRLVLRLLDERHVDGLRIDHADGLYDPTSYLWQLQERRFLQRCRAAFEQLSNDDRAELDWDVLEPELQRRFAQGRPQSSHDPISRCLYLIVEKILEGDERLHAQWPVHGSTGYEFLNQLNALFVDRDQARAMDAVYSRFAGPPGSFSELVRDAKRLIMRASMSSELSALGYHLDRLSEQDRYSRDFTQNSLTYALREIVACFPVYRTYITDRDILDDDRKHVELAVNRAIRGNPAMSSAVFEFIRDLLIPPGSGAQTGLHREETLRFVGRFQQFTGPMMAKAVEDTAFYRYHRLVSLNEVGGSPERFGTTPAAFHRQNLERREARPHALLATTTHDTKRSEDVRARINVLSELPREWGKRVARWSSLNRKKKVQVDGELAPSRNDEFLLYQTLIGTWPWGAPRGRLLAEYTARLVQYMQKALREAKVHTSWIAPHDKYEEAVAEFVSGLLDERRSRKFLLEFEPFAAEIAACGLWNSLSQTLLKLTSPGVPDIYQGAELWDLSLVDPDNRRPVDYALRERMLRELDERAADDARRSELPEHLLATATDGAIKLWVISRTLRWRRFAEALFTEGEYLPLVVHGARADHVFAFARRHNDQAALIVVPRLVAALTTPRGAPPLGPDVWRDTCCVVPPELAEGAWRHAFTGEHFWVGDDRGLPLASLLGRFPVALLAAEHAA